MDFIYLLAHINNTANFQLLPYHFSLFYETHFLFMNQVIQEKVKNLVNVTISTTDKIFKNLSWKHFSSNFIDEVRAYGFAVKFYYFFRESSNILANFVKIKAE